MPSACVEEIQWCAWGNELCTSKRRQNEIQYTVAAAWLHWHTLQTGENLIFCTLTDTERTRAIVPDWVVPRASSARFCAMTPVIIIYIAVKQFAKTVIKSGRPAVLKNQRIDISNTLYTLIRVAFFCGQKQWNRPSHVADCANCAEWFYCKRRQTLLNEYFMGHYSLVPHGSNAVFWDLALGCITRWCRLYTEGFAGFRTADTMAKAVRYWTSAVLISVDILRGTVYLQYCNDNIWAHQIDGSLKRSSYCYGCLRKWHNMSHNAHNIIMLIMRYSTVRLSGIFWSSTLLQGVPRIAVVFLKLFLRCTLLPGPSTSFQAEIHCTSLCQWRLKAMFSSFRAMNYGDAQCWIVPVASTRKSDAMLFYQHFSKGFPSIHEKE